VTYSSGFGFHFGDSILALDEHFAESEINDLDVGALLLVLVEEVLGLKVSVDDALGVAVVDAHHDLLETVRGLNLGEELFVDDFVEELATGTQLGDQVEVLFVLKVLVQLQNMGVVQLLQDRDLSFELLHVLHLLAQDCFTGTVLLAHTMAALGHHAESSGPEGLLAELVDFLEGLIVFLDHCLLFDQDHRFGLHSSFIIITN